VPALLLLLRGRGSGPVPRAHADVPCRLQICFNGHNRLAGRLSKLGIDCRMADMRSATLRTGSERSVSPTDGKQNESKPGSTSSPGDVARYIATLPPGSTGAWTSASMLPTSSSASRRIRRQSNDNLARTAIHTVKPENTATFLGRKLNPQFEGEAWSRL
jgi:hypothetical protein